MSAMVRPEGKARKIAWAILGVPANMMSKKTKRQREIDAKLRSEESSRLR